LEDPILVVLGRLQKQEQRRQREQGPQGLPASPATLLEPDEDAQHELGAVVERFGAPFLVALLFRRASEEPAETWERTVRKARPVCSLLGAPWRTIAVRVLETGDVLDGLAEILALEESDRHAILAAIGNGNV
jgi:hypothetical protein